MKSGTSEDRILEFNLSNHYFWKYDEKALKEVIKHKKKNPLSNEDLELAKSLSPTLNG